jgi:F0F1-type ATP synthase assembly protein I
MARKPDDPQAAKQWRQASLALSLPMMMLAGPIVGFVLAIGLMYWFEIGPLWAGRIKILGVLLGTMAGIRETITVIRKITKDS